MQPPFDWITMEYAGAHQFGAIIQREGGEVTTRLRTDAKGNLLRQGTEGSAKGRAVFARTKEENKPHKRFRETRSTVGAYSIKIPPRPFLPFTGSPNAATLQPEAERSVLEIVDGFLSGAFR